MNGNTIDVENLGTGGTGTHAVANVDNTLAAFSAGTLLGVGNDGVSSFGYWLDGSDVRWENLGTGATGVLSAGGIPSRTIDGTHIGIAHSTAANVSFYLYHPDTDNDGIANHLDLDSDGDGCYDSYEAGVIGATNDDSVTDSIATGPYGDNGFASSIETDDTATASYSGTYTYARATDMVSACLVDCVTVNNMG